MKNLMYKEFKLSIQPMTYFLLALSALLLIPHYPYFIAVMYSFITIPVMFSICKEQKDILFTVLLPIKKSDVVKARVLSVMSIELLQIAIAVPFALIRNYFTPSGSELLIDPNAAFFGFVFIMFAIFNVIFLPGFYKTGYKIAIPTTVAMIVVMLYVTIVEGLIQIIPVLKYTLDTLDSGMLIYQLPILLIGMLIFAGSVVLSYKVSAARFDKIDI